MPLTLSIGLGFSLRFELVVLVALLGLACCRYHLTLHNTARMSDPNPTYFKDTEKNAQVEETGDGWHDGASSVDTITGDCAY
jgi:hypothetical protein